MYKHNRECRKCIHIGVCTQTWGSGKGEGEWWWQVLQVWVRVPYPCCFLRVSQQQHQEMKGTICLPLRDSGKGRQSKRMMLKLTGPSLRLGTQHPNTSRTTGLVLNGRNDDASYFWVGRTSSKWAGTKFWTVDWTVGQWKYRWKAEIWRTILRNWEEKNAKSIQ